MKTKNIKKLAGLTEAARAATIARAAYLRASASEAARVAAARTEEIKRECARLIAEAEATSARVAQTGFWAGELGHVAERLKEMRA